MVSKGQTLGAAGKCPRFPDPEGSTCGPGASGSVCGSEGPQLHQCWVQAFSSLSWDDSSLRFEGSSLLWLFLF